MQIEESDNKKGSPPRRKGRMKTKEIIDIENYLRENGIKTIRERIEFLKNIDPNNIDPDLVKLGLKSKADRDQMIQDEEQMYESVSVVSKIVGNNPVFDVGINDSVLSTIAHIPAVNDLGVAAQVAAIQQSFGPWMAEVANIAASIQQSFGPGMAEVANIAASIQQSFGGFEQFNSQLEEIASIAGAAQNSVRLGFLPEPTDLASHLGIDEDLQFGAKKSQNHFPPKSGNFPEVRPEKDDLWGTYEEGSKTIKALLAGIEENSLVLSMLAMMTLSTLNDPNSLSNPAVIVAIVIIWMIALAPLAKRGEWLLPGDVNGEP
jgi:hypothetical protein